MMTHAVHSRYSAPPDKGRAVCILAVFALLGMAQGAAAQTYPSRPVTLIVPFAAGGPTDVLARIIVEPMRAALGQPVIIENVGGAAGNIALNKVVREKARWPHRDHRQLGNPRRQWRGADAAT